MPSPQRLASALAEAGLPEAEVPRKLRLFASAEAAFARLASGPAAGAWWAPGRIEVFAKHTDYAGGESLLATVPRGFTVLAAPRADGLVRVVDAATGEVAEADPGGEGPSSPLPGFGRYVRALTLRLARNFPGAAVGADVAFASDLPVAAGLSSSSALTVGIAGALVRFAGLEERPEWREAIHTLEDRAGYFACLENGADFGPLAGTPGVGALTGSEDQTAILACRPGQLSRYSFLPVVHRGEAPMPAGWRFAIATSGVVAEKAGNAREHYNRAARAVAALLGIWNREALAAGRRSAPSLAAALGSNEGAEAILRAAIGRSEAEGGTGLHVRLTHFLRENGRAALAEEAFRRGDEAALGDLAAASQRDAEQLLGNQIPETSALAILAREQGAFAASAFGGGFGGAVWALVKGGSEAAERFAARWLAGYRERFPQHRRAEAFVAWPGPGLAAKPCEHT